MSKFIVVLSLTIHLISCAQHNTFTHPTENTTMKTETNSISEKLATNAYGDFFNYHIQSNIIEEVWKEAGGVSALKAIVIDEKAPTKARMLAHEVLLKKEFTYLQDKEVSIPQLAEVYTKALAENLTGMANSWGLLYKHNDVGPVGIHLTMLGEETIPALLKLLHNETVLRYQGSEEATIGNAYQFRVKDFAAYYICKIKNITPVYYPSHQERDAEIERLKVLLKADK